MGAMDGQSVLPGTYVRIPLDVSGETSRGIEGACFGSLLRASSPRPRSGDVRLSSSATPLRRAKQSPSALDPTCDKRTTSSLLSTSMAWRKQTSSKTSTWQGCSTRHLANPRVVLVRFRLLPFTQPLSSKEEQPSSPLEPLGPRSLLRLAPSAHPHLAAGNGHSPLPLERLPPCMRPSRQEHRT